MIHIVFVLESKGEVLGDEAPPAECPPIECGQSDGDTSALHRKDRVSLSALDTGAGSDRTLAVCVRSR